MTYDYRPGSPRRNESVSSPLRRRDANREDEILLLLPSVTPEGHGEPPQERTPERGATSKPPPLNPSPTKTFPMGPVTPSVLSGLANKAGKEPVIRSARHKKQIKSSKMLLQFEPVSGSSNNKKPNLNTLLAAETTADAPSEKDSEKKTKKQNANDLDRDQEEDSAVALDVERPSGDQSCSGAGSVNEKDLVHGYWESLNDKNVDKTEEGELAQKRIAKRTRQPQRELSEQEKEARENTARLMQRDPNMKKELNAAVGGTAQMYTRRVTRATTSRTRYDALARQDAEKTGLPASAPAKQAYQFFDPPKLPSPRTRGKRPMPAKEPVVITISDDDTDTSQSQDSFSEPSMPPPPPRRRRSASGTPAYYSPRVVCGNSDLAGTQWEIRWEEAALIIRPFNRLDAEADVDIENDETTTTTTTTTTTMPTMSTTASGEKDEGEDPLLTTGGDGGDDVLAVECKKPEGEEDKEPQEGVAKEKKKTKPEVKAKAKQSGKRGKRKKDVLAGEDPFEFDDDKDGEYIDKTSKLTTRIKPRSPLVTGELVIPYSDIAALGVLRATGLVAVKTRTILREIDSDYYDPQSREGTRHYIHIYSHNLDEWKEEWAKVLSLREPIRTMQCNITDATLEDYNIRPWDRQTNLPPIEPKRPHTRSMSRGTTMRKSAPPKKVITYPKNCSRDVVTITQADLQRLEPDQLLNDNIIEFYLKYLREEALGEPIKDSVYFYNTFFWPKLQSLRDEEKKKVLSWTRNVDIFEKRFLFVPVNDGFHWNVVAICNPGSIVRAQAGEELSNEEKPIMVNMCSLGATATHVFTRLRTYLELEWNERKVASGHPPIRVTKDSIPGTSPNLPQQMNGSDCGVFLLHYVEYFCKTPPKQFTKETLRSVLNQDWFPEVEIQEKRTEIKNIISRLHYEQNPLPDEPDTEARDAGAVPSDQMVSLSSSSSSAPTVPEASMEPHDGGEGEREDEDQTAERSDRAEQRTKTREGEVERMNEEGEEDEEETQLPESEAVKDEEAANVGSRRTKEAEEEEEEEEDEYSLDSDPINISNEALIEAEEDEEAREAEGKGGANGEEETEGNSGETKMDRRIEKWERERKEEKRKTKKGRKRKKIESESESEDERDERRMKCEELTAEYFTVGSHAQKRKKTKTKESEKELLEEEKEKEEEREKEEILVESSQREDDGDIISVTTISPISDPPSPINARQPRMEKRKREKKKERREEAKRQREALEEEKKSEEEEGEVVVVVMPTATSVRTLGSSPDRGASSMQRPGRMAPVPITEEDCLFNFRDRPDKEGRGEIEIEIEEEEGEAEGDEKERRTRIEETEKAARVRVLPERKVEAETPPRGGRTGEQLTARGASGKWKSVNSKINLSGAMSPAAAQSAQPRPRPESPRVHEARQEQEASDPLLQRRRDTNLLPITARPSMTATTTATATTNGARGDGKRKRELATEEASWRVVQTIDDDDDEEEGEERQEGLEDASAGDAVRPEAKTEESGGDGGGRSGPAEAGVTVQPTGKKNRRKRKRSRRRGHNNGGGEAQGSAPTDESSSYSETSQMAEGDDEALTEKTKLEDKADDMVTVMYEEKGDEEEEEREKEKGPIASHTAMRHRKRSWPMRLAHTRSENGRAVDTEAQAPPPTATPDGAQPTQAVQARGGGRKDFVSAAGRTKTPEMRTDRKGKGEQERESEKEKKKEAKKNGTASSKLGRSAPKTAARRSVGDEQT